MKVLAGCVPKVIEISRLKIIDRQTKAMTTWEGCYSRLNNLTLPGLLKGLCFAL